MPQEVVIEFDAATQSLAALNAAAYRMIGMSTCQVETSSGRYVCRLGLHEGYEKRHQALDVESVRMRFIDLVTE